MIRRSSKQGRDDLRKEEKPNSIERQARKIESVQLFTSEKYNCLTDVRGIFSKSDISLIVGTKDLVRRKFLLKTK